jgi:hypothetical protein
MSNDSVELSPEEIERITHYKRAAEQLRELAELGIQAKRRRDNTVCVLRAHAMQPGIVMKARPKLKLA